MIALFALLLLRIPMTNIPLVLETLAGLAPPELPSLRMSRYLGDNFSVALARFAPADQQVARRLYAALQNVLAIVQANMDAPETCFAELRSFMNNVDWLRLVHDAQQLGDARQQTAGVADDELLSKVIHDIRGGGFQALSIQLQFLELGIAQNDDVHRLFFLARDHLKIMRNAVLDLDLLGYERDRSDNLHNIDLLTEKWQRAAYKLAGRAAVVLVDSQFAGNVSERCLEFAALDRVLYNLMNNAVRNTADERVYLVILPVPAREPHDLRFVVFNMVGEAQQRVLRQQYGENLSALFRGGFTTGGTGLGMRICGDFVTNAYGLHTIDEGIAGGYMGARLIDSYFVNWFHWPIAAD